MRLTKTALAAGLAACVTACSGGGSGTITPPVNQQVPPATGSTGTQFAPATSSLPTVTGVINYTAADHFTFKVSSGCFSDHGYLNVYTTSSTTFSGGSPKVGETATVAVSSGSCTTKLYAQSVTLTGGSSGTSGTAAQRHLLTADYLGSPYGTTKIAWSTAAPHLTWAQVGPPNANAISAAGIKTQYYADPNQTINNGDPFYTSVEATFAHTCSGSRVLMMDSGHQMYQMNPQPLAMQTLFRSIIAGVISRSHYDAVFEDGPGDLKAYGEKVLPCNYSPTNWLAYGQALNEYSPIPVIDNGLAELYNQGPSLSISLLNGGNTMGAVYEHCFSDNTFIEETGWLWLAVENTQIQVGQKGKMFWCMLRNSNSAASSIQARIFALASFLLTYNPSKSVLWEEFSTPSGLHVMPESQLVALNPAISTPSNIASLKQSGGTYARQYNACYYNGNSVGRCAIVVNSDANTAHPFPYSGYTHTLYLSGNGILDGYSLSVNGAAPSSSVPAHSAVIAF
ncbi:MAG TPA: hypothetical protein VKB39_05570 [Candidatus Baltobacteraceae bacterium]|nr:hypothetical protein [Candidatus Baltobacteraceae bacterium]